MGYYLAKARKEINFGIDVIFLRSWLKKETLPITLEIYNQVIEQYDMIEPMNEKQREEKKKLFAEIQHRFKEVSPIVINQ